MKRSTKEFRQRDFGSNTEGEFVDAYGSGPTPIEARSDEVSAPDWAPGPLTGLKLVPGTDRAAAESLARYVVEFGQGTGRVRTAGSAFCLELTSRDDFGLVLGQFGELVADQCAVLNSTPTSDRSDAQNSNENHPRRK